MSAPRVDLRIGSPESARNAGNRVPEAASAGRICNAGGVAWSGNALLLSENRKVWPEPPEMRGATSKHAPGDLMPPERARRPKGGGGPTAAAPKPPGASNGTLCPQVGVHGGGSLRPTQWRDGESRPPSLLDITLHWTRERRPLHRSGRADLDRLRRGRGNKALFPNLRRHPTPYAKRNVCQPVGRSPRSGVAARAKIQPALRA